MSNKAQKIGWIGAGRMGTPMAERLLKAGHDVSIWNRTRAKAEPLAAKGGKIVDKPPTWPSCDVVFAIVSTGKDVEQVAVRQGRPALRRPRSRKCWSTARRFRSRNPPPSASG